MNQMLTIFLPHIIGTMGALVILGVGWRTPVTACLILPIYGLLFLVGVGLTPSRWLQAKASLGADTPPPTTAIMLGFGYEGAESAMQPGAANQFLLNWLLTTQPQVKTLFVQEGIRAAVSPEVLAAKDVRRIHRHDKTIYVDTLDTAFCALQTLQKLGIRTVLLVTHDLQMQRAVWDFARVRQATCAQCTIVTATIPDTPYPTNSVHLQTRNELIYKVLELLLLRPRDYLRATPTTCKAPL